jgi:phosphohistidine phosphatase SixA
MRTILSAGGVLCLLLTACGDARSPAAPTSPPDTRMDLPHLTGLMAEVASGGTIVFFRHAARDATAMSTGELARADNAHLCVPGSELTPVGLADAAAIGRVFGAYRIAVDHVLVSPTCRTEQTAGLMFPGRQLEPRRELTWPDMWLPGEAETLPPLLRALLGQPPAPAATTVVVSHSNVLREETAGVTVGLDQADAAVLAPLGHGRFALRGTIPRDEWVRASEALPAGT